MVCCEYTRNLDYNVKMTPEPIIFIHIPRTGGMSFRKLMHITYGYNNIGRPWWGEHEGETITRSMKSKLAWYGHFKFGLHEQIPKPVKYITIIREPAARLLSEYFRNDYRNRYNMSPLDLAKSDRGNNIMVRMLSGADYYGELTPDHVDIAISNIEKHFVFVGQTEKYKDIMRLVKNLGWPVSQEPRENQGSKIEVTLDELMELRKAPELALDYDLYRRLAYAW